MIDAKELRGLDNMTYVASMPKGEIIKDMVVHDGILFVATDKNIYTLEDGKRLERVE